MLQSVMRLPLRGPDLSPELPTDLSPESGAENEASPKSFIPKGNKEVGAAGFEPATSTV